VLWLEALCSSELPVSELRCRQSLFLIKKKEAARYLSKATVICWLKLVYFGTQTAHHSAYSTLGQIPRIATN
jgi:hypothetical protein